MTAINERSALMRVFWNAMPVRRLAICVRRCASCVVVTAALISPGEGSILSSRHGERGKSDGLSFRSDTFLDSDSACESSAMFHFAIRDRIAEPRIGFTQNDWTKVQLSKVPRADENQYG
jgi:hypothetical protein